MVVSDPSDLEDLQKIKEFLAGKLSAFEFLFDKYREKIFGVAFRFVHDKEDAMEIVQDVFLRAYKSLSKFKTDSKFFTWLYRIAVNRAIDSIRIRKARPAMKPLSQFKARGSGDDDGFAASIPGPESADPAGILDRQEMSGRILEAVSKLSQKHQAVFLLHAVEELSYKEIADVLGCSIGTVMSRLFYARKKLQEMLSECGYC